MKIGGRTFPAADVLGKVCTLSKVLIRLLLEVKRPLSVLKHYFTRNSPEYVDLRSGLRVWFSSHPHDLITFFIVFLKRDYGAIKKDIVVIDIGANIGTFALFAASCGAKKVYAVEPSREAFQVLCRNIESNNLEEVIVPLNKAASSEDHSFVRFPISSSPYNKVDFDNVTDDNSAFYEVETISLSSVISDSGFDHIDLLKMDCEGAEFKIFPSTSESDLSKLGQIRMECHGAPDKLLDDLMRKGFLLEQMKEDSIWYDIWLTRSSN